MNNSFLTISVPDYYTKTIEKIAKTKKLEFNKVCNLAIKNFIETEKTKTEEYSILNLEE